MRLNRAWAYPSRIGLSLDQESQTLSISSIPITPPLDTSITPLSVLVGFPLLTSDPVSLSSWADVTVTYRHVCMTSRISVLSISSFTYNIVSSMARPRPTYKKAFIPTNLWPIVFSPFCFSPPSVRRKTLVSVDRIDLRKAVLSCTLADIVTKFLLRNIICIRPYPIRLRIL